MLFNSTVPATILDMVKFADYQETTLRKNDTAKRLDLYHDAQLERLEEQLTALFSDPSQMIKVCLNVIKKVVNNLAQTYREPPTRIIEEGTDQDRAIFAEITASTALDLKLKLASRYLKLLKTILLRPVWRNNALDLDVLTGNILDVQTGASPEILERVLVTDYGTTGQVTEVKYSLWDAESWSRLDYMGRELEAAANPYGVLPFLALFDFPPPGSQFWLPGGDDLISLQEAINLKLVDLCHLLATQSFGVGYIKGSQGGGSLRVDPGSLVELQENGEIGFAHQAARIEEVVNAIDRLIKWAAIAHGLSAASMSTDPTEASGLSKLVDTRELSEMRVDDIVLWRTYEAKLFNIMRVIWNAHNPGRKISDAATLQVQFFDPTPKADPRTQAETWALLLNMGVISQVDIALERDKDLRSREDAMAYLQKAQDERKQLGLTMPVSLNVQNPPVTQA